MAVKHSHYGWSSGFGALTTLAACAAAIYGLFWWLDFGMSGGPAPWQLITEPGAAQGLSAFTEVIVGVLGIAITVVAIIVELAANRYTPRVSELFVADPINRTVMSFFVVTSITVLWVDMSLYGETYPKYMATGSLTMMTLSFLLILPYFAFVFDFLTPTAVISRIQGGAESQLLVATHGDVLLARARLKQNVEQLGDISLNSVDKKDKPLTLSSLEALAAVAIGHIRVKPKLPEIWFDTAPLAQSDPDFIALHEDMVIALTERRTWLEMKIFRQYQAVFGEALNRMRDVNHLIAIHTRTIACSSLDHRDMNSFALSIRFLNTYMRATLNAKDVRSAYNLLNEYRLLGEYCLHKGHVAAVLEIAEYISYYGQLAFSQNLAFLLETAAYDLCTLLERAYLAQSESHSKLLALFLEVDREPDSDGRSQEQSLRGVRKAQIKLATFYLAHGDRALARQVFEDMRYERVERLERIRAELERVETAEFWEVSDRGINFEWLAPERRAQLDTFFSWFDSGSRPPESTTV